MLTGLTGQTIFTGKLNGASARGDVTGATFSNRSETLDRLVPRARMQRGCNHTLFSFGCQLLRDDWQWDAAVYSAPVAGYPFALVLDSFSRTNASPDPAGFGGAHWFAGGYIEIGTGLNTKRYPILDSAAIASGRITLTLSKDLLPVPAVAEAVRIWPTCDQRWETCGPNATNNPDGKFNNRLNFFGQPFMPDENPTFVKKQGTKNTGKKG